MNPLRQALSFFRTRRDWLGAGGQPVDQPTAQIRANTCNLCQHNQARAFEDLFKGAVANQVKRQLELKANLQLKVEGEQHLHTCKLCGCWLPLKCFVPLKIARANTPDWQNYPGWCWLRTECENPEKND